MRTSRQIAVQGLCSSLQKEVPNIAKNEGKETSKSKKQPTGKITFAYCEMSDIGSVYHQFHSAIRTNYDLEQALRFYYQKVSPSQWRVTNINAKDFIPIEGVSLSIHQRKALYAKSFK